MSKPDICNDCGQRIRQAHKETLSKMKLNMLQRASKHVIANSKNDFMVRDIAVDGEFKQFNNFQKLRYHGLVTPVRVNDERIKGRWLITRNGWSFLRGELELPKWVKVRENSITERSPETIHVKDVYRGAEEIVTTFEYFDEQGNMVGVRPSRKLTKQQTLL